MKIGDEVWLYHEENYHDAALEAGPVSDEAIFLNMEDAVKKIVSTIQKYEEEGFVLDKEDEEPSEEHIVAELKKRGVYSIVMFYQCQDNFEFSFAICAMKMEIK